MNKTSRTLKSLKKCVFSRLREGEHLIINRKLFQSFGVATVNAPPRLESKDDQEQLVRGSERSGDGKGAEELRDVLKFA